MLIISVVDLYVGFLTQSRRFSYGYDITRGSNMKSLDLTAQVARNGTKISGEEFMCR
jgi:hypothetical protein